MLQKTKNILKYLLPNFLIDNYKRFRANMINVALDIKIKKVRYYQKKALTIVRNKTKIKVVFFLPELTVWKLEGVYRLMEKDIRFDPIIIICPFIYYAENYMLQRINEAYDEFKSKGYNVIKTFDENANNWLDVKKEINPDIIFFLVPHNITRKEYLINNFDKKLNCYVPYTFQTTYNYEAMYNRTFHNILWKAYYQTEIHHKIAIEHAGNKGQNVIISGYPGIDVFLKATQISSESKKKAKIKKSIIWAPHHTIEGEGLNLNFSNFLQYHEFMIDLAEKYKDFIYITFKPHPLLKSKLNKEEIWGKERTDKYYNFWKESHYCDLNEGNYDNLFIESNAMIHDCDSFLGEYLALNKPVLYTRKDDFVEDRQNEFGKSAIKMHYQAKNKQEIMDFINKVVIDEEDTLKEVRSKWISDNLTPPNSISASMNIFIDLKKSLQIV